MAGRRSSTSSASTRWPSSTGSTTPIRHRRNDGLWIYGILFVFFYLAFLVWQTYYAILTASRTTWGTRPSTHAAEASA